MWYIPNISLEVKDVLGTCFPCSPVIIPQIILNCSSPLRYHEGSRVCIPQFVQLHIHNTQRLCRAMYIRKEIKDTRSHPCLLISENLWSRLYFSQLCSHCFGMWLCNVLFFVMSLVFAMSPDNLNNLDIWNQMSEAIQSFSGRVSLSQAGSSGAQARPFPLNSTLIIKSKWQLEYLKGQISRSWNKVRDDL